MNKERTTLRREGYLHQIGYPSTDPEAYLDSLEKVAALPVKRVFPAHHSLDIKPEILIRMREAFRNLKADGNTVT